MPRNSQVTAFIVLGMVVLLTMGFMIWRIGIHGQSIDRGDTKDRLFASENIRFRECASQLTREAVDVLCDTGLIYPEHHASGAVPVAYYYIDGRSALPTMTEMENQLEIYVANRIDDCAYSPYARYALPEERAVKAVILPAGIVFDISYPALVSLEASHARLKDVKTEVPVGFSRFYSSASDIVHMTRAEPGWIDSALLLDLPVNVTMSYVSRDTIVYALLDDTGRAFNFAVKVGQ